MKNPLSILRPDICIGLIALALPAIAQVPNRLIDSIPAPPTGAQSTAQLGYGVAVDGAYTVVGAPYDDIGAADAGAAKVFNTTTGALLFVIKNPSPQSGDRFGSALAISGTRIVIGAYLDDNGVTADVGRAYVYDLSSATPTVPVFVLNNPSPAANDWFGYSVAISGTVVVVGCSGNDVALRTDAGSVYVYDLASGTATTPVATLDDPPSPGSGDQFGYSVGISGTRIVVGAPYWDDNTGSDAGAIYSYDLSIDANPHITVNPFPAAGDRFGYSVAISGTRVVVGSPFNTIGPANAGSAYVYTLGVSQASLNTVLNNPAPAAQDFFGNSVAISGTRVVVGAYFDDAGATDAGSAYVYDVSSASPDVPTATLNNPGPATFDYFGRAVAISGAQVVVGASGDNTQATDAGSAYVYNVSSATPTTVIATLDTPSPAASDFFGSSVAVSGTRMVVGAPSDDTGASNTGSAYVYDLSSGTPTVPIFTLNNPSPDAVDNFGFSVAISGTRVVVGAYQDDTGASNAGRAYVYELSSATPTIPAVTLNNPSPVAGDTFGRSVGIDGVRVVVGADGFNAGSGRAYVYDVSSVTPAVPTTTLNNPSVAAGDSFGVSVAISGTRVVVGAYQDEAGATYAGSAYVYDTSSGTPTVPIATLNKPSPAVADFFGWSVAISGTRVAVGVSRDDAGATDAGSVYVYDVSSATPTVPVAVINNPSPAASDFFGSSVAISGSRVVVGAWQDDTGATDAGSAYVYDLNSGTPTVPLATLNNPSPSATDQFGFAVAIDGTTIAIGTPYDDTVMVDKGYAYVFGTTDTDNDGLLDSWELTYWPSTTGHNALDDSDHDGYCELLELAFGLNPTLPDAGGLPAAVDEGGYLTMTITKQAGVIYEVQSAGSLLAAQPNSFSATTTTVITNNATTLKVRDNFLIGTSPPRFMRVKVTAAP